MFQGYTESGRNPTLKCDHGFIKTLKDDDGHYKELLEGKNNCNFSQQAFLQQ